MKVTLFNGSPRQQGNTAYLLNTVAEVLNAQDIDTETISIGGKQMRGCIACFQCIKNKNGECAIDHDPLNECLTKMMESQGIIIGSPTYFGTVTAETKALIDRAGFVSRANGDLLKRKVGAAVVAVRRGGAVTTFDTINRFFTIGQMIVVGSNYWNFGIGRDIGDVAEDTEGIATMKLLGENMAWALKKIHA